MMNWNGDAGGTWWAVMCVAMLALVGTAMCVAIAYAKRPPTSERSTGQQILDERLAKGEITPADHRELSDAIRPHR